MKLFLTCSRSIGFLNHFKAQKCKRIENFLNPPQNPKPSINKSSKKKRQWLKKSKYKRIKTKLKKKTISIVYNYSDIVLTPSMEALLNLGISFAIRPQKLNISEMLADHQRLARGMTWMDYFSGQDSDSSPSTKPKIFK